MRVIRGSYLEAHFVRPQPAIKDSSASLRLISFIRVLFILCVFAAMRETHSCQAQPDLQNLARVNTTVRTADPTKLLLSVCEYQSYREC